MKTLWEDLVNKGSNFADFVRSRPHTYARTQQSLPPLMGGNKHTSNTSIQSILELAIHCIFTAFYNENPHFRTTKALCNFEK